MLIVTDNIVRFEKCEQIIVGFSFCIKMREPPKGLAARKVGMKMTKNKLRCFMETAL